MNKKFNFFIVILLSLFFAAAHDVRAQNQTASNDAKILPADNDKRPNLLRELGLSREQIQQVRRIMQERQNALRQAKRRLQAANEALDAAIYADSDNESDVQARLKELQAAHTELTRNRTESERAVRRILTAEQLNRFRNLRGQFMQNNKSGDLTNRRQDKPRNRPENFRLRRPRMGRRNP